MAKVTSKETTMSVTVGKDEKEVPVTIFQVEADENTTPETLVAAMIEAAAKTSVRGEGEYDKVLENFNYGVGLKIRAAERQAFLVAAQGPEKAVAKISSAGDAALKALIAGGMSEDEAKATLRQALGL